MIILILMKIKKTNYWIKGGIIGTIILLIIYLLAILNPVSGIGNIFYWIIIIPFDLLFSKIFENFFTNYLSYNNPHSSYSIIFYLIGYFLIGSLIGWIVGKMKK